MLRMSLMRIKNEKDQINVFIDKTYAKDKEENSKQNYRQKLTR